MRSIDFSVCCRHRVPYSLPITDTIAVFTCHFLLVFCKCIEDSKVRARSGTIGGESGDLFLSKFNVALKSPVLCVGAVWSKAESLSSLTESVNECTPLVVRTAASSAVKKTSEMGQFITCGKPAGCNLQFL